LAGGLNSADSEVYSPNGGCSNSLPPIPEINKNPHFAYINQEVFYCPSQNSDQCYLYDAETNTWVTYTSMTKSHTTSTSTYDTI
jgi:hypothetical protein